MASADGKTTDPLIEKLQAEPFAFDFYAAVRLLQSRAPEKPRIGHSWSPTEDPVRFAQSPALDFASSTLEAMRQKDPARPPVLYSRHFGVFGPNGPLPLCLTEFARQRILHHGDATFTAFCNVFHHRLLSFFFRAWADARKTVDFDRPDDEHWAYYVGALVGLGMDSLRKRDRVPDSAKFYFAGRLAQQNRCAEGLEAIVREFFGIPTELQTFVGRWMDLPADSTCRLGSRANGKLGTTAIAGRQIWTCQLHFRLRFGPLKLPDFERMLPNGASFMRLRDLVRLYAGEHYSWDVQMLLDGCEIPSAQVGRGGRLGWTTWLRTGTITEDAEITFPGDL